MRFHRQFPTSLALAIAVPFLSACGKSTVKPGHADPDFSLESLRAGTSALIVSGDARVPEFKKTFGKAFGSGEALAAHLSARILDSLTRGEPALPAIAAAPDIAALLPGDAPPARGPEAETGVPIPAYILRVRNITIGKLSRELPAAILPALGQNAMAPAGGGTSESCVVSFDVEVWETGAPDGAARRLSFTVTSRSDVVLYAYKSALIEAVNAAARRTARHLRGN